MRWPVLVRNPADLADPPRKTKSAMRVWSSEEVHAHLKPRTEDTALADPAFKLGVYFKRQGNDAKAKQYFEQAQRLSPGNWNYHRQDWTYEGERAAGMKWYKKSQALGDTPYYDALELPGEK